MLAIAWTTALEAIQQPIALILLSAVLTTLLVPVFQFHRFGEDGRLARIAGCRACWSSAWFWRRYRRAFGGGGDRAGTAAAVIGKPVSRVTFKASKWLGRSILVTNFPIIIMSGSCRISARTPSAKPSSIA